jgi:hypothetical protein
MKSSGSTNRANTFPLKPVPFSPEGDMIGFSGEAPLSAESAPEARIMAGVESVPFRTALELPWTACEYCCMAIAGAGRTLAVAARTTRKTELRVVPRFFINRLLFGSSTGLSTVVLVALASGLCVAAFRRVCRLSEAPKLLSWALIRTLTCGAEKCNC